MVNIFIYTLMCYGLTALISFLVIGLIVGINKVLNSKNSTQE